MRILELKRLLSDATVVVLVCALLACAAGAVGVRAAESVATNLDLMSNLTSDVVKDLYARFAPNLDGRSVRLQPYGTTEDYIFVSNVFVSELTEAGVKTMQGPGAAPVQTASPPAPPDSAYSGGGTGDPPLVLKFQNVAFSVGYPDIYRSHLVGGKHVRRSASVRVLATLTDGADGRVVWTGEAERNYSDEFDHEDSARIQQGTYVFAQPEMPSTNWGKYAEPVFVTGIIVGLIYLFFSNQSDN